MNIENVKLKKITLITLFMFAIMIILPGFISSFATKVNASYSYKTIKGNTRYSDKTAAKFFGETLQKYNDENVSALQNQNTIKNWIGTGMGNFTKSDPFASSCILRRME